MKNLFLCLLVCIGFTPLSQAQFRKIPSEVTHAFKKKYPVAEKVTWKDRQNIYQAAFSVYGIPFTADFTNDGYWQESAQEVLFDSLPSEVIDGVHESRYAAWRVKKAALVVTPGTPVTYRVYMEKSGIHKKYLFFTADGRLEKEALTL
jgi:hypothetical protein